MPDNDGKMKIPRNIRDVSDNLRVSVSNLMGPFAANSLGFRFFDDWGCGQLSMYSIDNTQEGQKILVS